MDFFECRSNIKMRLCVSCQRGKIERKKSLGQLLCTVFFSWLGQRGSIYDDIYDLRNGFFRRQKSYSFFFVFFMMISNGKHANVGFNPQGIHSFFFNFPPFSETTATKGRFIQFSTGFQNLILFLIKNVAVTATLIRF